MAGNKRRMDILRSEKEISLDKKRYYSMLEKYPPKVNPIFLRTPDYGQHKKEEHDGS